MKGYAVKWLEAGEFLKDACPESVLTADFGEVGAVHADETDAWVAMNRLAHDSGKTLAVVPVHVVEAEPNAWRADYDAVSLQPYGGWPNFGIVRRIWMAGDIERVDLFEGFTNEDQQHWNKDAWFNRTECYWEGGYSEAVAALRQIDPGGDW